MELSRPSLSLPEILSGIGSSVIGVDETLRKLQQDLTACDRVEAKMDEIVFERLGEASDGKRILNILKDYLSSP